MVRKSPYYQLSGTSLMPQEEMLETTSKSKQLIIGILKDDARYENRIPLTPQGVEILVENGHQVLFETEAGNASNFTDHIYSESGAIITNNSAEIFKADVIIKVSPFTDSEIEQLSNGQTIISLLSLHRQNRDTLQKLINKRINAIAFELLKDDSDSYPVLRSMNEIDGYASIIIASEYLSKEHGGKGVLLGGITGMSPAEVVILGAGTAGEFAARAAMGLGAMVKIFDDSYENLREIERNLGQRVFTSFLHPHAIEKALKSADAVLGNIKYLVTGQKFSITEEQVQMMKKGSVIVDLSMDQGGCFETSRCTNCESPIFTKHNVIHYCVPNISSRVPRTASIALSNIFAPILLQLAEAGAVQKLSKENIGFRNGLYIYNGILTNRHIGTHFDLPYKDLGLLMAAF